MKRLQQTRHVLGSDGIITLVLADGAAADELFAALWARIAAFEQRFSRFLSYSELTQFNHAGGKRLKVSPELHELLLAAKTMSEQTGGLYSPFILPALQRAGYQGSWPNITAPRAGTSYDERRIHDVSALEIGDDWARMPADAALDFGGIGKGYLLDELAARLAPKNLPGFWLSLGGDIVCAGVDADGGPWRIGIQHAQQPETAVQTIANEHGERLAIATSGITKRKGVTDGRAWHHLIDPRSGQPAETDILTATVCGASATEADVFAKCLVLLGSEKAQDFAAEHHIGQAILQTQTANHDVVIKEMGEST